MSPNESIRHRQRLLALMGSHDNRAIKNGIQGVYELLRDYPNTPTSFVNTARQGLSRHLTNQDPYVTPWIYSLIGVLKDLEYEPYLRSQLRDHEYDPVNRTWAVASLASVTEDHRQVLHEIGDELTLPYKLASAMYRGQETDAKAVRAASESDDRLAHLWVCLLFSEQRAEIPIPQIKELTGSRDAEVAQYALFALHKRPHVGIDSVTIGPQDLMGLQPRVRRWYYQLLIQDPSNLMRYGEMVRHWMTVETHTQAREGLAKGFIGTQPSREWIHELRAWAESERDQFVLDALGQIPSVNDIVTSRGSDAPKGSSEPTGAEAVSDPGDAEQICARDRIVVVKGGFFMDMRDQSVNISGSNTIGVVQGAGSTATGNRFLDAKQQQIFEQAPALVDLLNRIVGDLREREEHEDQAGLLEVVVQDLEKEQAQPVDTNVWRRMKARFAQAAQALSALAAVTTDANEVVTQAQHLIHSVVG